MLNDSSEAESILHEVKQKLNELFHANIPIFEKYKEMFKEDPPKKVKIYLDDIGVPLERLGEIYKLIKKITKDMKESLD